MDLMSQKRVALTYTISWRHNAKSLCNVFKDKPLVQKTKIKSLVIIFKVEQIRLCVLITGSITEQQGHVIERYKT